MNLYHDLPLANEDFSEVNCILEIPKNGRVKYEFDHTIGAIRFDRIEKTPMPFPFNYGDLPQTWNEGDNDPLDVIILCSESLTTGVVVPIRVIGGMNMIDSGEFDYKILAVTDDKFYEHVNDIDDVSKKDLENIEYFYSHYKDLRGKKVEVKGFDNKAKALEILKECHEAYKKKFGK